MNVHLDLGEEISITMIMSNLWSRLNYKSTAKYILNTYITEYDLSKANINALLYTGRIDETRYNELLSLPKEQREIAVGLMIQKDNSIYKSIQEGIIEAKKRLFDANDIEDYDVLSIRNDAVFIHSRKLNTTEFPPYFIFKEKGKYNMFMSICDLDVFYNDTINPDGSVNYQLDIKGISEEKTLLHANGIGGLLCEVMYRLQREDVSFTIQWMTGILEKYLNRQLPKEFYREFNSDSDYVIRTFKMRIASKDIPDGLIPALDINRNLLVIRDIMEILTSIHISNLQRNKHSRR